MVKTPSAILSRMIFKKEASLSAFMVYLPPIIDKFVKSRFSLPWREGIKGRGILTHGNYYIYSPSPPPSPIEGEGILTFYELSTL
jgi:hypothetical protein